MTPQERRNSSILNGSRRARVAKGAGVHVSEVNGLLERFGQAQKMMRRMGAGIPGLGGGGGKKARGKAQAGQARRGKKGRSGNPAKRAQQEAAAALTKKSEPGSGLRVGGENAGVPGRDPLATPGQVPDLPPEFKKLLGGE